MELWLRAMLEVGYTFGWRVSEVKSLRVQQIDPVSSRTLLDPGNTKNDEGRAVKFKPGSLLASLLAACCEGKQPNDYLCREIKISQCAIFATHGIACARRLDAKGYYSMICAVAQLVVFVRVVCRKA